MIADLLVIGYFGLVAAGLTYIFVDTSRKAQVKFLLTVLSSHVPRAELEKICEEVKQK
jgi:hypothetical protein